MMETIVRWYVRRCLALLRPRLIAGAPCVVRQGPVRARVGPKGTGAPGTWARQEPVRVRLGPKGTGAPDCYFYAMGSERTV